MTALILAGQRVTAIILNGLPVTLSPLATGSVSNSNAETIIGQFTIPAGDPAAGAGYAFRIFGTADATGTPTIALRLRLNTLAGTQLATPGTLSARAASGMYWACSGRLNFETVGSTGVMDVDATWNTVIVATAAATSLYGTGSVANAVDTTAAISVLVTADWSVAATGNTARTLSGGLGRTP